MIQIGVTNNGRRVIPSDRLYRERKGRLMRIAHLVLEFCAVIIGALSLFLSGKQREIAARPTKLTAISVV